MRFAMSETKMPRKVPLIGHLPIVRQFQVLGVLLVTFLVFAALIMSLDVRTASQVTASAATATEMQMLSQRLARGAALASQGQAAGLAVIKDSRERFVADLDALQRGGTVKGVALDVVQDETQFKLLQDIKARWDRVDANTERILDNQQGLTSLANGVGEITQGAKRIGDAARQVAQLGASPREVDYANQLAALSQRIARSAAVLVSAAEIDPDAASLLGRDAGAFREAQGALGRGGDAPGRRARAATTRAWPWPSSRSRRPRSTPASTRSCRT